MSNSEIEQSGTVKGHLPNEASLSGRISNIVSLSGHISIGSVASDFIIKMTIEVDGNNYTVTSCDKTMEQIDAAVASGQNIKAIAFDKFIMPLTQIMENGTSYTFGAFLGSFLAMANVYKNPESGADEWEFYFIPLAADIVEYSNDAMPRISTVGEALDKLVLDSHTHANKAVLDKFAESDGQLTYDGEALDSDFIIKMTVETEDGEIYTVTSCDATFEQIDAAVAAEKKVVVIATDNDNVIYELPMISGVPNVSYTFSLFLSGLSIVSIIRKNDEGGSYWVFVAEGISAYNVNYQTSALPNISTVGEALDALVPKSHAHSNKSVLDKFAETDGKPTYDGEALGGGASDFIIKMTIESHDDGNYYTVASCDATIEQIDAAVAAEKRVVLIATDTTTGMFWELPIVQAVQGATYMFIAFTYSGYIIATVYKSGENEIWEYMNGGISAESVSYYNSTQPDVTDVNTALYKLFDNSHTHANKDTLDKLSVLNGKLQYNGSDVGLKGDKGDTPVKGTDYWTAADKTEIVNDILAALPTWTGGGY